MPRIDLSTAAARSYDLAVVGAGAAGLALAQAATEAGLSVLLLERGGRAPSPDPDEPEIAAGVPHDSSEKTIRQGLGGTLNIWGGRCIPFDPADFGRAPGGAPGWPISYEDYAPWIAPAARFLGVEPQFERAIPSHWPALEGIALGSVERLGPARLRSDLRQSLLEGPGGPDLLLESAVLGLTWADRRVTGVEVASPEGPRSLSADHVALAGGGLQATRLLLIEERRHQGRIAGSAHLGQSYMGHLTGSIAEITFANQKDAEAFGYSLDPGTTTPARRRFLMTPPEGNHVALWVESLGMGDARHGSGELSIKALARGAGAKGGHLANLLRDPGGVAAGLTSALRTRLFSAERHPNRLIVRRPGPYRLAYHAEHLPGPESRVTLGERKDRFGLPRLRIDFDYGSPTIAGTVAAHRQLGASLAAAGFARLEMMAETDDELAAAVAAQARDGYHQIGMTRMSETPDGGVVDPTTRVHGTENLYVASASTFPVSSQANPTLSVVALALRLAAHLGAQKGAEAAA